MRSAAKRASLRRRFFNNRRAVYTLHAHPVFVTTYRRPVFTDPMLTCCERLMRQLCADIDADLAEFNGETDHVHLLVHYPPSLALSVLVNRLTGVSSRRLRQQYPEDTRKYLWGKHFWSPSYFAACCGGAPVTIIKQYIEQQNRPDQCDPRAATTGSASSRFNGQAPAADGPVKSVLATASQRSRTRSLFGVAVHRSTVPSAGSSSGGSR